MDWLTFISKVIEAIIWPATIAACLFAVRKYLPAVSSSLRRIKYRDVEFEFGETARAVAAEVKETVPSSGQDTAIAGQSKFVLEAKLEEIAEISPRAAILEAWLQVEAAAVRMIRERGLGTVTSSPGPLRLLETLRKAGILNARQLSVFEELRLLRNEAVHGPDTQFTKPAVASYIESAIAMASYLEDLMGEL
ncbi:hypothetical protein [Burkholderia sp. Ed8]|uniref:hypothetical protein n=1 Tax=Burkholderia sp. Ed8 TaxID=3112957 RepID=UPI00345CA238